MKKLLLLFIIFAQQVHSQNSYYNGMTVGDFLCLYHKTVISTYHYSSLSPEPGFKMKFYVYFSKNKKNYVILYVKEPKVLLNSFLSSKELSLGEITNGIIVRSMFNFYKGEIIVP